LLLEVVGLKKVLGGAVVFDDVTFAVAAGSSTVIRGGSGCGKTTLLRCLNGLEPIDAGSIRVDDVRLVAPGPFPARALQDLRRRLGIVFQQWNLFAHRTVLDNVTEAPIHVARQAPAAAVSRARQLLERVGVHHRADAYPHRLSGGEQQRVAIARALAMQPDVLLLDEPTSALDGVRAGELLGLLAELRATGLTLVTVTHDDRVCDALGEQVLTLEGGRLRAGAQR
jgi:polar amino acid transport system ATP-binding protein